MSTEKTIDHYVIESCKSYSSNPPILNQNSTEKIHVKRLYIKFFIVLLLVSAIHILLHSNSICIQQTMTAKTVKISIIPFQQHARAYIITGDCKSARFNITKMNIERVFPNFFNITCFLTIPLNDSRIHTGPVPIWKKFSSNLLAFIDIWTYQIPKHSTNNEYEWSFIFEDDVNFSKPSDVFLQNYTNALQELMNDNETQQKDGFIYLGICEPIFDPNNRSIISANTNNSLFSKKAYGYCLHASGITTHRARLFWTDISQYRPTAADSALDLQLRDYCIRSKQRFNLFGSNFHYPPGTGHHGIAYQDRGKFLSTIA